MISLNIASWIAIFALASSYWFQIWKIHVHKEVRDISIIYHVLLALGFGILIITAYAEDSLIFLVKQVVTFVPVLIIIGQIVHHRKDRWHDAHGKCLECSFILHPEWNHCPYCGKNI